MASLADFPLPDHLSALSCPEEDAESPCFSHFSGLGFGDLFQGLDSDQFSFGWGGLEDQALEFSASDASCQLSDATVPCLEDRTGADLATGLQVVPAAATHQMPRLQLDYGNVLSAWAEMGGQVAEDSSVRLTSLQKVELTGSSRSSLQAAVAGSVLPAPSSGACQTTCSQKPESALCSSDLSSMSKLPASPRGVTSALTSAPTSFKSEEELRDRAACLERYREKKRNRAFSKTIRYEMRKINAERRPRYKGRFVKRSDLDLLEDKQAAMSPFRANSVDSSDSCLGLGF